MYSNHITRWLDEECITLAYPRKPPEHIYIRFGKWSRNHKSTNFSTGKQEQGLSVYNAILESDGTVSLIADDSSLKSGFTARDCARLLYGRLAFVVTGKVKGYGSDGEPLLLGVKVLPYAIKLKSLPARFRWRFGSPFGNPLNPEYL